MLVIVPVLVLMLVFASWVPHFLVIVRGQFWQLHNECNIAAHKPNDQTNHLFGGKFTDASLFALSSS